MSAWDDATRFPEDRKITPGRTVINLSDEGPSHDHCTNRQRQVGWIHSPSGKVFSMKDTKLCESEKPFGSMTPIYIDLDD